ncbi:oligopeptide ABC transporter (ATP-binding protein) [Arthrobacter sp. 9V]|uniref:ABC transporter ATP-binding protein n=1 Tax=Arthrobacter sp. 9V TaxID=2653132 RepID=UPI0012F233B1|nr:oligopeptide/dipeptide ABC transporter ATP-binding protein [Arthrobacter sp. 9V]VXB50672.1 oligopeptide ABC transporter (ATP-binding protein) [Arthrobacter sp. 9V]
MSELRFEQVSVRFGGRRGMTAVDGVDLVVPRGQVVGLVGESGSGKSTLARAAAGLTPLSGGRILLKGQPLSTRQGERRPLQMVFQDPHSSLNPRMSIGDSIAESLSLYGKGAKAKRTAEVQRLLEMVGLDPQRAFSYPGQMSGGQLQRVALARALAGQPEVIIADEITSALDVSVQGTVLNLVRDLQRELRLSMLFISHNLAVVRYVADRIAVMYLGRIVEQGPAEQILSNPQHPYTKDLLAAVPSHTRSSLTPMAIDPAVRAVNDAEPADPHHPPSGCRYHMRCPIGPLVLPGRGICKESDPAAEDHQHAAACHFADELLPAGKAGLS